MYYCTLTISVESTMKELRDDTTAIKDSLAGQQDKVNETIVEIERAVDVSGCASYIPTSHAS